MMVGLLDWLAGLVGWRSGLWGAQRDVCQVGSPDWWRWQRALDADRRR